MDPYIWLWLWTIIILFCVHLEFQPKMKYGISMSQMTTDMFCWSFSQSSPFLIHDLLLSLQQE
jgi:hypothetical protein